MKSQMELIESRELNTHCVHGARGRLVGSAPNSDRRSTMVSSVSSIGGNVGDDKRWDDKVISIAMEIGLGDIGDGKDV